MQNFFVSVIVPNYNHAKYLDLRMQTILNQTYRNIEVIVLDDKSSDNSIEIINKYKDDNRVKEIVVNKQNCGSPFLQWKKGFNLAKGDYIWIAESDDFCDINFLEIVLKAFDNKKCVLSFSRSIITNSNGIPQKLVHFQRNNDEPSCLIGKEFVKRHMKFGNYVYNASSVVFRKDVLNKIPLDYCNYKGCGDWLFWIYIAELGEVNMIPQLLNNFRRHSSATTSKLDSDGINDTEMLRIYDYLNKKNYYSRIDRVIFKIKRLNFHSQRCQFTTLEDKRRFEREWHITKVTYLMQYLYNVIKDVLASFVR